MCTSGSTMAGADHFDWSAGRRRLADTASLVWYEMTDGPGNPSFYEVLGVPPTATTEDVRAAYRRLCRQTHPDAGGNSTLFHLVARAHDTLSDPIRRAEYDDSLRQPMEPARSVGGGRGARRAVQRVLTHAMSRRAGVGAFLGLVWYLLRSTGALTWALGDSAAERPVPAAVEAWAQPTTGSKAVACVVVGAIVATRGPFARLHGRLLSVRRPSWTEWAVAGCLVMAAVVGEYLLTVEGRRVLVVGSVCGGALSLAVRQSRLRRPRADRRRSTRCDEGC